MEAALPQQRNVRRGKLEEEDGIGLPLPPRVVIGPDENGTRKVIEYHFDDEGNKVKVTTTLIRKLVRARLCRNVIERRSWPKFGDAVNDDAGSRFTMHSTDEILLERPHAPGNRNAEEPAASGDPLVMASDGGVVRMVCTICCKNGDHWTSKCPYRDLAPQVKSFADKPPTADDSEARGGSLKKALPLSFMMEDGYRIREAVKRVIYDDRCVRVTNISEETRESDLAELFGFFGFVLRVYLPVDKNTGSGRGIGFVQFAQRREAEAAIRRLNGHTYDDLVLQVEWAAPGAKGALPESPIRKQATGDEYRVCVTNLSKDTREADLFHLFCRFGMVTCVHVAVDEKSGSNTGVGFVDFVQRDEAEHAIRILNGHTYDNLVLELGGEHQHQESRPRF